MRIGSAEVTGPVLALPEVRDAAAVPRRTEEDEEIWLLIVPGEGVSVDAALEARIRDAVRRRASPRHVPRRIVAVPDLPRTRSGKTMELAIAEVVNGAEPAHPDSAANPEAFEAIAARVAGA